MTTSVHAPDSPVALDVRAALARVVAGGALSAAEMAAVVGQLMDGQGTPAQIGGLLIALRMKGETVAEIAGAAAAMRARATPLRCPEPERAVDTCGTGGDGSGMINVSTLAAIAVAGAGGCVAKHGNRALSSRSGSADVLEALGVKIDAAPAVVERCLRECGIGFAFAPAFHAATKHVAGPRRELGTRTLFNLLGPLTNPAGTKRQVVGVFDRRFCAPLAAAFGELGARRVFVVHGDGAAPGAPGVDELAVRGETFVAEWTGEHVRTYAMTPADFGLEDADPAGLAGGDAADNAAILRRVLAGESIGPGEPLRAAANAAVMTAALALVAIDAAADARSGAELAAQALRDGRAADVLARWARLSHEEAGA
ncbi:MAG: anthranilate phosphoribosyltransferase [Kofleriaceae bacterium]